MRRRKRFTSYVRLANGNEQAASLRVAFRMAVYETNGQPFYVLVQRGFPNQALAVGRTKRDIQRLPILVRCGRCSFREWAGKVKRS